MKSISPPLFEFESSDSIAQFAVWALPLAGGGASGSIAWGFGGVGALTAIAAISFLLVVGLRSSISVHPGQVTITRKWFAVPYKRYSAPAIEDVSFGGDYGLEDGAMGIVVHMGGSEVHFGTAKNMRYLYEALTEIAYSGVARAG